MKIGSTNGETEVAIGMRVDLKHQGQWEVVRFSKERTYSPAVLGGTPVVVCKPLGDVPHWIERYLNDDGTCDFCGDSIAGALIEAHSDSRETAQ